MKNSDVIRAWKDPEFRASLSEEQRAALPAHPAGAIEVADDELGLVEGGAGSNNLYCVPVLVATNRFVSMSCPMVRNPADFVTIPGAAHGAFGH